MDVIEVKKPQTIMIRPIQELIARAMGTDTLLTPYGWDSIAQDIYDYVVSDNAFILLGAEKGEFKSLVMGYFPTGNLFPYPTIFMFYNEGSPALLKATRQKLLDTLVHNGYTKAVAVNNSGKSDDVWLRGMTAKGAKGRIIGSFAMFEVE